MNIKIDFKGKVHKLATGLTTLQDIYNDIQTRYPKHFSSGIILGFINHNAITQIKCYEQLVELAKNQPGNSLKLKVFEAKSFNPDMLQHNFERKVSKEETTAIEVFELKSTEAPATEISSEQTKPIIQKQSKQTGIKEIIKNELKKAESQSVETKIQEKKTEEFENEKKYRCLFCNSKGEIANGITCQICRGEKQIANGHPFISFIDEIIADRLKTLTRKQKIVKVDLIEEKVPEKKHSEPKLQKQEQQKEQKQPKVQKEISKIFSFNFEEAPSNTISSKFGQEFLWNMKLTNNGTCQWPKKVYVYRIFKGQHYEIFQVGSLAPGELRNIAIGFKANHRNSVQLYQLRLGYSHCGEGVKFFGPKFGFEVDTRQEKPVEKLKDMTEELKKQIEYACKFVKNQKHNIAYLANRIKQLNLGDIPKQMMIDLINSLQ